MLTERQEKLLNFLVKEYIDTAEPVSSLGLKKVTDLDVSGATIRNDLQELTKQGFIDQPHTSAGRVPTKKAYKYIADKLETPATFYDVHEVNVVRMSIVPACRQAGDKLALSSFIEQKIRLTHQEVENQMKMMQEIMQTLENDNLFDILNILDKWHRDEFKI